MRYNFEGKTVWITGASSGIGEALAYAFVLYGANTIISARRKDELERVKTNCGANAGRCHPVVLDLAVPENVDTTADAVLAQFGPIDILINNGGISTRCLVDETALEIDRRVMEVNYFSAVALTKKVLPQMIKNGGGHLLATSSLVGKFGFPLRSAYSASKHALHGFFESLLAENTKHNIRVTMIIPGRVKTNISLNAISKDGQAHGQMDDGQADGISATEAAETIIKAIIKNKKEIPVGGKELIMLKIRRFLPALYYRMARKLKAT